MACGEEPGDEWLKMLRVRNRLVGFRWQTAPYQEQLGKVQWLQMHGHSGAAMRVLHAELAHIRPRHPVDHGKSKNLVALVGISGHASISQNLLVVVWLQVEVLHSTTTTC